MADLSTQYLGFELKNPIIVASSTLVQNIEGVKEAAAAGAGAIVLRSLFEELIREETEHDGDTFQGQHPEEYGYILNELQLQYGPQKYLELIRDAKQAVDIPIIASINCTSPKWWINYVKQIEAAGADAIELNLSLMPTDPGATSLDIEQQFISIVKAAREVISVPIAAKIGPYFTSLSRFANQLCGAGADALVLFNRFYQFDIDIDAGKIVGANWYSNPAEMSTSLRWISILYKHVNGQLAATTGVHDTAGVIKQLLAGAQVVELASALYLNGLGHMSQILKDLEDWMDSKQYSAIGNFRGALSLSQQKNAENYERLQYIKALTGIHGK